MLDRCPVCGMPHDPAWPHDPTTTRYQRSFFAEHGRVPTWADSMAHCAPEIRDAWTKWLKDGYGIDANDVAEMIWGRSD